MIGVPYRRLSRPTTADRIADAICIALAVASILGLYVAFWAVAIAVA